MFDGGLSEVALDHADLGLPDRPLTADDVAGLRFRTGLRGYRMEDVDAAIARLGDALRLATGAAQPADQTVASSPAPAADREVGQA
jgi:DivIVA domain-containing protein